MGNFLKTERKNSILIVRMDSPETHNALTHVGQMEEITYLCHELERDRSVKVVILTGNGKSFCSGGNVKDMRGRTGIFAGNPYELRNSYRNGIQTIPLALYNLEVPVIAAINGAAIGAGLDLACMCDIRIASSKAIFAESFVKLGIVPGDGGAWLLQKVIGGPKASLMALTGQMIKSDKALAWDLVTEIVEPDELETRALELAQEIAANPGPALRLTKRLLREAQHMKLDSLLEMSAAYQALAHHTEEHVEAVDKFFNRKPKKP